MAEKSLVVVRGADVGSVYWCVASPENPDHFYDCNSGASGAEVSPASQSGTSGPAVALIVENDSSTLIYNCHRSDEFTDQYVECAVVSNSPRTVSLARSDRPSAITHNAISFFDSQNIASATSNYPVAPDKVQTAGLGYSVFSGGSVERVTNCIGDGCAMWGEIVKNYNGGSSFTDTSLYMRVPGFSGVMSVGVTNYIGAGATREDMLMPAVSFDLSRLWTHEKNEDRTAMKAEK